MRAILDMAGGQDVKVIPCKDDMLYERISLVLGLPEPDWDAARPADGPRGGAWGSQRTILFSGMKCARPPPLMLRLRLTGACRPLIGACWQCMLLIGPVPCPEQQRQGVHQCSLGGRAQAFVLTG